MQEDGTMLITERVVARTTVADEFLARHPEPMALIAREVVKRVIAFGEERAWKIRADSVYVREVSSDKPTDTTMFEGVWSPEGARFVGGEYDGDVTKARRESDGYPLSRLTLLRREGPSFGNDQYPIVTHNPVYRRAGIDPIDDIWVYELMKGTS